MKITTIDKPASASTAYSAVTNMLDIGPELDWEVNHITVSAWLEHVPFAFWLMKALRPGCFVELGTERGVSYAAFCQAVERLGLGARCYAVDTWQGDEHSGHYDESVYSRLSELNDRHYRRFSSLLRTTFAEALPYFADGEVDLLHIDGLHTYEAVANDFATWRPKLSNRAVVLFHDVNVRRDEFGVWRLWRELAPDYPHFEFVHGHGLGILGVGKDLPAAIRALFDTEADRDAQMAVRGLFSARGTAVQRAFQLQSTQEHNAALATELNAVHGQSAALQNEIVALQNEIVALQNENAALRSESIALQQQITTHQQETALAFADSATLQQQAEANLAALRLELTASEAEASALRKQLDTAGHDMTDLRSQLGQALAEVRDFMLRPPTPPADTGLLNTIEDLKIRLAAVELHRAALLASTSWRVTSPMRLIKTSMLKLRPDSRELAGIGRTTRHSLGDSTDQVAVAAPPQRKRVFPPASQIQVLRQRVLIVAELSLPQCKKYRVDQKQAMIRALGWDCSVVGWQDADHVINLMQTHTVVIFYRVPGLPDVERQMQEARSLGLPHYFELDDLIFDLNDYGSNPNLTGFDPQAAKGLFEGAALYRKALEQCGNVIASTPYLAERMQRVGKGQSFVIENALDVETLEAAETFHPKVDDGIVRIIYGSGTRTHDADFRFVASALYRVAVENPNVVIVLIGELNPPEFLFDLGDRLQQLAGRPYRDYLELLAQCDIAIAPLWPANFNEAKSNIKFLEAATMGVPSVCSPRSAFAHAIRPGETGLLAESEEDWHAALRALVLDPQLRQSIGDAARRDVLERYSPHSVGLRQVQPLLDLHTPRPDQRLHILQVNLLYRPQSFGGATLVMEEMVRLLKMRHDTRVSVFASAPAGWLKPYEIERAVEDEVPVFRIGIQDRPGWTEEAWDEAAAEAFREVLRALRPDVVHFHAMQGLGAALLMACHAEGIPFVVTPHDAWWLCERQFLVTSEGKYCGQRQINLNVCATCVTSVGTTVLRNIRLRRALEAADLLVAPSRHWQHFYQANGFAQDRICTNENGISLPSNPKPNRGPARLRFGFVGGAEPVKGFPIIKKTFEALERDDWELVIINNGLAIGLDKFAGVKWDVKGTVRIVPPFNEETRDAFYNSIDVLLFPSQWPESFGLTVREALARNRWVIATDQGGAAEAIVHGVNGTLIPLGDDISPFRMAIENLLDRKPNLEGWVNPLTDRIRDFAEQARELRGILASVAAGRAVSHARAEKVDAD
jgi:O-antigen biosynthesis protein